MTKLDIKSYNLEQLKNELSQMGEKPFRAGQIYKVQERLKLKFLVTEFQALTK